MPFQASVGQLGVSEENTARLHGPIGLVPSLRDVSLIAVSALAEVVAAFPAKTSEISAHPQQHISGG